MTIDEVIDYEKRCSERRDAFVGYTTEEHKQLVEWLEELKAIRRWKADVIEDFCRYDASSFEEIVTYAKIKAIEELLKRQLETLEDFKEWEDVDGYPIHSMSETQRISKCKELIKQVAEQALKQMGE